MATFTITLDEIEQSGETIFYDDTTKYPIFDEAYREGLNQKIIDHYRMYEIGQETIGQFRFALNRKMREIMPYYNQLYQTVQNEIDPFKTMDYTDHGTSDSTTSGTNHSATTGTSDSTNNSASRAVASEMPQVHLSPNEDYATSANDVIGNATTHGTTDTSTDDTTSSDVNGTVDRHVTGSQGHQATLMMQYRKSLLNIDMNVISELESLFMQVWDNGDEFYGGMTYGWFGWSYPI